MALQCLCDRWVSIGSDSESLKDAGGFNRSQRPDPEAALTSMRARFDIVDPPSISQLQLLRSRGMIMMTFRQNSGKICSIFDGLFLIDLSYSYRGDFDYPWDGRYLAYDAFRKKVCPIPPLALSDSALSDSADMSRRKAEAAVSLGSTAVAAPVGAHGVYFFADLVTNRFLMPQAELRMWTTGHELIKKPVFLPPVRGFKVDNTFLVPGSQIFWVDLLAGAFVCNLLDPESSFFVQLPSGCQQLDRKDVKDPDMHRTMGYVNGSVWFVSVEPDDEKFMLKHWILSSDFQRWEEGDWWAVEDIWATRHFQKNDLPRVMPTSPVLSMTEYVIYVVLSEFKCKVLTNPDFPGKRYDPKAQYVVELDMRRRKVLKVDKRHLSDFSFKPELYMSGYTGTFDYIVPILNQLGISLDGYYEEGCTAAASTATSVHDFTTEEQKLEDLNKKLGKTMHISGEEGGHSGSWNACEPYQGFNPGCWNTSEPYQGFNPGSWNTSEPYQGFNPGSWNTSEPYRGLLHPAEGGHSGGWNAGEEGGHSGTGWNAGEEGGHRGTGWSW